MSVTTVCILIHPLNVEFHSRSSTRHIPFFKFSIVTDLRLPNLAAVPASARLTRSLAWGQGAKRPCSLCTQRIKCIWSPIGHAGWPKENCLSVVEYVLWPIKHILWATHHFVWSSVYVLKLTEYSHWHIGHSLKHISRANISWSMRHGTCSIDHLPMSSNISMDTWQVLWCYNFF